MILPGSTPASSRANVHHQIMTAPASMVFYNAGQHTPNMDYFSPLTSPALGPSDAHASDSRYGQEHSLPPSVEIPGSQFGNPLSAQQSKAPSGGPRSKRRSSVDEPLSRKRASPLFPPTTKQRQSQRDIPGTPKDGASFAAMARGRRSRSNTTTTASASLLSPSGQSALSSSDGSAHLGGPQNTPSPVSLDASSMPPPAPPSSMQSGLVDRSMPSGGYIAPVTPGSIMNLASLSRLATGFSSSLDQEQLDNFSQHQSPTPVSPSEDTPDSGSRTPTAETPVGGAFAAQSGAATSSKKSNATPRKDSVPTTRSRAATKSGKAGGSSTTATPASPYIVSGGAAPTTSASSTPKISPSGSNTRNAGRSSIISPGLKPILPGGLASADAVAHLSLKSNYQNILEGRGKDLGIGFPAESHTGVAVKKTSHKAAEQKRRDSLKSGFDDLRILLPPVTYDPDKDGDGAERPAGSLPPRGPPRNMPGVANEHPNRGVSKLALLRGANEHIVRLQRRVDRRDDMIEKMRRELAALRLEVGVGTVPEETNENDDEEEEDGEDDGTTTTTPDQHATAASTTSAGEKRTSVAGPLVWKDIVLVDLEADLDAIEEDEDEERSARLAACPSENLARLATQAKGHGSSSSSS